ncbi:MAG TPA: helix-hairpin-helix domain-containing protein [Gemmatimonadales bacterium]|jgi:competence protein ComEA|nr:helix-hairpin-helix domain-containing protein [Gemmatimonadales bacterium]
MDDRKAALVLACLALAGGAVRYFLSPSPTDPPGDVRLQSTSVPRPSGVQETARRAAHLARPLLPGERVDLDHADVSEITRLPRIGPALAQRIVAWRTEHGPFGSLARLDSVPGVGAKLLDAIRPFVVQP